MLTCQRVAMCRHKDEYSHGCGLLACHSNAQKRTIEEELTPPAAFLSCCLSRCIAAVQSCVQVKLQHTSTHAPSSISLPLHCCRTKLRASQTPTHQHSHPQQHFSAAALLPYKVACKSNSGLTTPFSAATAVVVVAAAAPTFLVRCSRSSRRPSRSRSRGRGRGSRRFSCFHLGGQSFTSMLLGWRGVLVALLFLCACEHVVVCACICVCVCLCL